MKIIAVILLIVASCLAIYSPWAVWFALCLGGAGLVMWRAVVEMED